MAFYRLAIAALLLTSFHSSNATETPDYSDSGNWLCHPEQNSRDNVCLRDQAVIRVAANGSSSVTPGYIEQIPAVDCFYVYPTASMDVTANSNMTPDVQEKDTAATQFGRYAEVCRTFAPVYRQRTLTYLGIGALGDGLVTEETMAKRNGLPGRPQCVRALPEQRQQWTWLYSDWPLTRGASACAFSGRRD